MKIAYASVYSSEDPNTWSGLNRSIANCLLRQGFEVTLLEPLYDSRRAWLSKVRAKIRGVFGGGRFLWTRDQSLLRHYGAVLADQLAQGEYDVVFSPGTEAIAYLPDHIRTPVVIWTDATFASVVNYYAWYTGLAATCIAEATATDNLALRRATFACYSSEWAIASAMTQHGADPAKLLELPFGPNVETRLAETEVAGLVLARQQAPWRFLFVGVDWIRKGGNIALAVITELNRRGYPSELDVVGCRLPRGLKLPAFVRWHGFVNRGDPAGARQLTGLYHRATFFLLPSQAEAFGIVFAESAAHALPVLATRTGGIPTAVTDGVTGHLFAPDAPVSAYVEKILQTMEPGRYPAMAQAAHTDSVNRLNWDTSGARLRERLAAIEPGAQPLQRVS